jgi:hypothetical protein
MIKVIEVHEQASFLIITKDRELSETDISINN